MSWGEASDVADHARAALAGAVQSARERVDRAEREAATRVEAGLREIEEARARHRAELIEARNALAQRIDDIEDALRSLSAELAEHGVALTGGRS